MSGRTAVGPNDAVRIVQEGAEELGQQIERTPVDETLVGDEQTVAGVRNDLDQRRRVALKP